MDHSPGEERDCGNKPMEADLSAVRGAPSVHQPCSANDGGGVETQNKLLIKPLSHINKQTSNLKQLTGNVPVIRAFFVGSRLEESACASSVSLSE